MAKYDVTYSCGHKNTIELLGKMSERYHIIEWYEEYGFCPACHKLLREKGQDMKNAEGCTAREMPYVKYKEAFGWCKTKHSSYNTSTETIVVYIPQDYTLIMEYAKIFNRDVTETIIQHVRRIAPMVRELDRKEMVDLISDIIAEFGESVDSIQMLKVLDLFLGE